MSLASPPPKPADLNSALSLAGRSLDVMIDANQKAQIATLTDEDVSIVVPMGDIGVSKLYGQYQEYQSFGLDVGFRRYAHLSPAVCAYGEGTVGIAFINETDVVLVAPQANRAGYATDFSDRTAAFSFGVNVGVLVPLADQVGVFGQVGLRWMTGMSEVDGLTGTGLETINDSSSRWTVGKSKPAAHPQRAERGGSAGLAQPGRGARGDPQVAPGT